MAPRSCKTHKLFTHSKDLCLPLAGRCLEHRENAEAIAPRPGRAQAGITERSHQIAPPQPPQPHSPVKHRDRPLETDRRMGTCGKSRAGTTRAAQRCQTLKVKPFRLKRTRTDTCTDARDGERSPRATHNLWYLLLTQHTAHHQTSPTPKAQRKGVTQPFYI